MSTKIFEANGKIEKWNEYDNNKNVTYQDSEMLSYDIIGGNNPTSEDIERRTRVRQYVAKIRQEGRGEKNDYRIIKSFFEKTPVEGSPFPFIIGMEDIPFSDFNFINAGGRGFARRINDFAFVKDSESGNLYWESGGNFRPEGYFWGTKSSDDSIKRRLQQMVDDFIKETKINCIIKDHEILFN